MRWKLLICIVLMVGNAHAQLGINGYYQFQSPDYWTISSDGDTPVSLVENVPAFGVDFRIKPFAEKRIDLIPEIRMALASNTTLGTNDYTWSLFSFNLNTNIYPLDFNGDCNCPTFSKQNTFFKKGFYFRISPGVSRLSQKVKMEATTVRNTQFLFNLGVGAGLDIGVSRRLTVSPFVMGRFYPELFWNDLEESILFSEKIEKKTTFFTQLNVGFRVEFQIIDD